YDLSGVTAEPTSRSAPLSATNEFSATIGNRVQLDVSLVYLDSRHAKPSDLARAGNQELDEYSEDGGVSNLLERQHDWLEEFWASSDVEVGGDDAVQQSLRFSLFHLVQGAGRDGKTNIASKALT